MSGEQPKRHFARAVRRENRIPPSERHALLLRFQNDPRHRALRSSSARPLDFAVANFADGDGKWWHKVKLWAALAGVSESTVKRAIRDGIGVGLLKRERYRRPDGLQGSSTYFLDPSIVWPEWFPQGGSPVTQPAGEPADPVPQGGSTVAQLVSEVEPPAAQGGSTVTERQGGSTVAYLNGSTNRTTATDERGVFLGTTGRARDGELQEPLAGDDIIDSSERLVARANRRRHEEGLA